MIFLLCCESRQDSIKLISVEGKKHSISSILFKYFHFCFAKEPSDGCICRVCWRKVDLFHEFYMQIQSIYEQTNKNHIVPTELIVKEESFEYDIVGSESSFKCEPVFSDYSTNDAGGPFEETLCEDQKTLEETIITSPKRQSCSKPKKSKTKKRKPYTKKPPRPVIFKCAIKLCADEFATKEQLITHKINDHRRIQCTHSPDLKLVLDLNLHLKNMHGIIQTTICEQCGQEFHSNASFMSHVKGVHEQHEPLQCDICKDWFKTRDSLRSHMTYVHIQGPQTCQICGKVSTNRKSLLKHQKIHIESRKDRFKCIVCGKGFRDNTKLREHSYIHSGVTDAYSCNFCGKNFRFGSSLSAHRMKVHPTEMADVKYRLQWKKNVELKM